MMMTITVTLPFHYLRIVAGIGEEQFNASVVQKLPLVATDESIFAMGSELGWSASWVARRSGVPVPIAGGDVAAMLNAHPAHPVPPPPVSWNEQCHFRTLPWGPCHACGFEWVITKLFAHLRDSI